MDRDLPPFNLSRAENTALLPLFHSSPSQPLLSKGLQLPYFSTWEVGRRGIMTTTNPDGSEDVNDFLSRIRELGDRRDKEDEERTKKLEEEILQGRKERQARRAGTKCPSQSPLSPPHCSALIIDGAHPSSMTAVGRPAP